NYVNVGWVLTPLPNTIPQDGSTIHVYVDGVNLGSPTYGAYRPDIAALFPQYANSGGSQARFQFDTTNYRNGLHTISWGVTDSAGNSAGIGSRFFEIRNTGSSRQADSSGIETVYDIPLRRTGTITVTKGVESDSVSQNLAADADGSYSIQLKELQRVEMDFGAGGLEGYLLVGKTLESLPIGSTLDKEAGKYYWQPGPGFYGQYNLVFIETGTGSGRLMVTVNIGPAFE
ncbi:MAG: hypothetical protein GY765_23705, partial [bacterium]|nr:hypothetical protein [bacterium]